MIRPSGPIRSPPRRRSAPVTPTARRTRPPGRSPWSPCSVGETYAAAGVSIEAGDEAVRRIGPLARSTFRPEVLADIGGFGSLVAVPGGYREPVLVSSTDGVGTKLLVAAAAGRFDTV